MFWYVNELALKYLLRDLTVTDLGLPLLSTFHLLPMKFILVYNKICLYAVSEVTWAQEN
jgi:hypothetical protein